MRALIETYLILRKQVGDRSYYDCPNCRQKDGTGTLVVTWANETFICNHMASCGFQGHISQLAKELNIDIPREQRAPRVTYQQPKKVQYKVNKISTVKVNLPTVQTKQVDINDRVLQLEALFDRSAQLVCCIDSQYGKLIPMDLETLEYDSDNYTHFKINAGGSKAEDIKDYKYTLVECDEIADMSLQRGYLESINLPIASLTWSGNKSLHAVVKVNAPDMKEYKRRVELIHEVCDGVGFKIDKTKDCCRFTRLAGSFNNKTGNTQKLIALNIGAIDWNDWEMNQVPRMTKTENVINTADIKMKSVKPGFSSGFLTHDYNDSGMKPGLTLLTGKRNQGKTTFSRQLIIGAAKQNIKVFAWYGEGTKEMEKGYLARLVAKDDEIVTSDNGYGRTIWSAGPEAERRYDETLGKLIDMYVKPLRLSIPVFKDLLSRMTDKARQGTRLFIIDNMMKLTSDQSDTNSAQQRIISSLKEFCDYHEANIVLIAHPRKGDGDQSVSGAMEQENTADTILRFKRIFDQSSIADNKDDFPPHELPNVTAVVINEKVRDGGKDNMMYMEFDHTRQANIEITYIEEIKDMARDYQDTGYYSRPATYVGM
jgi:archaellum biogenesis ATPase FlaH